MIMASFKVGENRYHVKHETTDDSRKIMNARTPQVVMTIDRGLTVSVEGKVIGSIKGYTGNWIFYFGGDMFGQEYDTDIATEDYCWKKLLAAEVSVATFLINQGYVK